MNLEGTFDITLPDDMADTFRRTIIPHLSITLLEEPAEQYYQRIKA